MKMRKTKRHALDELHRREIGVRCPWWSSIRALRHTILGPRRHWKLVLRVKENSLLELNSDLMWVTKPVISQGDNASVMHRICSNGYRMPLFKIKMHPRPKEVHIYDIPHPVYRSTIPQHEYRHVICALRKGNVLTRHDLYTGEMYNQIHLGNMQTQSLNPSFMQDMVIVKSAKLKFEYRQECFFHFDVFQMHPFALLATFNIDGLVFPAEEHRKQYGKLRSAEINDGMLLIMTDKQYCLIYNAQEIIEDKRVNGISGSSNVEQTGLLVTKIPPLLFVTYAHMDILGLGACPWTYIHAISDYMLEVRDLRTHELLEGGRVTWKDSNDQKISPDYLMFFPDDSNRLVHLKTSELRVLAIEEINGKRILKEVFRYPEKALISKVETATYSRSGRLIKSKYIFDESLNRALAFDVEMDLMIFVILEAKRDIEHNCTFLLKATFYNSLTYDYLYEVRLNTRVEGDIETHRLSVHIDRDIMNIVSNKGVSYTVLSYRLKEFWEKTSTNLNKIVSSDKYDKGNSSDDPECQSSDYEASLFSENDRRRRRSSTNNKRQRNIQNRNFINRRSSQHRIETEANSISSDEWTP